MTRRKSTTLSGSLRSLGLSPMETLFTMALVERGFLSKDDAFDCLYGAGSDAKGTGLYIVVMNARRKLLPRGVTFRTIRAHGWQIDGASIAIVRAGL